MGKTLAEMAREFSTNPTIQKEYGILEGRLVRPDAYLFPVPAQQPFGHSARLGVKISIFTGRELGKYSQMPNEGGIVEYPFVDDEGNKVMVWQAHYLNGMVPKEYPNQAPATAGLDAASLDFEDLIRNHRS